MYHLHGREFDQMIIQTLYTRESYKGKFGSFGYGKL